MTQKELDNIYYIELVSTMMHCCYNIQERLLDKNVKADECAHRMKVIYELGNILINELNKRGEALNEN